jgi:hypothetical protein
MVIETGSLKPTGIVAESERQFLLNYPNPGQLAAGQYQLTGELIWAENDERRTQPFSVDLMIPTP